MTQTARASQTSQVASILKNPFTPTFGIVPTVMAGRGAILQDMERAFEEGLGNPHLATILVGARGTGKTVLLACIADLAAQSGWITAKTVASSGMLDDILQQTAKNAAHIIEPTKSRQLSALNIGQLLGIEWIFSPAEPANWRSRLEAVLDNLKQTDTGLLIEVDEVNSNVEEMIQLVSTYQLLISEGYKVALVMAGFPSQVTDLVEDGRITFLRRAMVNNVGKINDIDVVSAFQETIDETPKRIDPDALAYLVSETNGFAFMMQLIGYCTWQQSQTDQISLLDAKSGVASAKVLFEHGVLDATFNDLSAGDIAFLNAMLQCNLPATLTEIAKQMNKGTNYASTYKTRLIKQGVIGYRGKTKLDFDIPHFAEYLTEKN